MTTSNQAIDLIVARFNWLANASREERGLLRDTCARVGHVNSGERFLTTNPIYTCLRCGENYQEAST